MTEIAQRLFEILYEQGDGDALLGLLAEGMIEQEKFLFPTANTNGQELCLVALGKAVARGTASTLHGMTRGVKVEKAFGSGPEGTQTLEVALHQKGFRVRTGNQISSRIMTHNYELRVLDGKITQLKMLEKFETV